MEENSMEKLIATLKRHEGVKTHAYRDSLGVLTIGCGRNINNSSKHKGIGISMDEIEYLLQNDIERTIKELSREYPWFNDMEEGGFKKALIHMENGSHNKAATEFLDSRWAKQVKGRSLEVTDMIKTNTYV